MNKPTVVEKFADNGEHDHWELIDSDTGEILWTEPIDAILFSGTISKEEICVCPICDTLTNEKQCPLCGYKWSDSPNIYFIPTPEFRSKVFAGGMFEDCRPTNFAVYSIHKKHGIIAHTLLAKNDIPKDAKQYTIECAAIETKSYLRIFACGKDPMATAQTTVLCKGDTVCIKCDIENFFTWET